ncbi:ABC transporter ATP-binding protein [Actinomadura sp. WMMA1423]|uniref:ABC transporter ATP-binding protein n=1 Tax=Actinomadura sp. WMMA1423 TaxID=2591108 RepID=UPI00197AC0B2|nr:ABC transporter ATP-binding protein [Actinomadura sp. WMMA1423]
MSPAVRMAGVRKSYGDVRAVDGLDLTIERGETVALLGRNGAGKSTAISIMLGLVPPEAGTVELFGRAPARALRDGLVGAMLQEGGLVPRIKVRELVSFVRGTFPDPMPYTEILETAGLVALADKRVDKLSGGQSQRVRFALALAGDPDLIVLDEPTAALDVEARRELWTAMRADASRGKTVVFCTHYLEEADQNAGRIVIVDSGRITADGTGAQLKEAVSGRIVSFELREGTSTAALERLPGVTTVEVRGGRAILRTLDSDATLAALGPVPRLEVTGVGLEDAFVALTGPR